VIRAGPAGRERAAARVGFARSGRPAELRTVRAPTAGRAEACKGNAPADDRQISRAGGPGPSREKGGRHRAASGSMSVVCRHDAKKNKKKKFPPLTGKPAHRIALRRTSNSGRPVPASMYGEVTVRFPHQGGPANHTRTTTSSEVGTGRSGYGPTASLRGKWQEGRRKTHPPARRDSIRSWRRRFGPDTRRDHRPA